jgi:hypothetical protein
LVGTLVVAISTYYGGERAAKLEEIRATATAEAIAMATSTLAPLDTPIPQVPTATREFLPTATSVPTDTRTPPSDQPLDSSLSSDVPEWFKRLAQESISRHGIAGISLGEPESTITDAFGQPSIGPQPALNTEGDVAAYKLCYEHNTITFCIWTLRTSLNDSNSADTRHVYSLRLRDSDFNQDGYIPSVDGITIGSTSTQVNQAFGNAPDIDSHDDCPNHLDNPGSTTLMYPGIRFWICDVNNLVYQIEVIARVSVTPPLQESGFQ